MNKLLAVLLFALCISFPLTADCGSLIIQPGNTLSGLSLKTGNSVEQLMLMNGIDNPDKIKAGKRLYYVSKEDITLALDWAKSRKAELPTLHPAHLQYNYIIDKLEKGEVRYRIEDEGVHYTIILQYSSAHKNLKGAKK